MKRLLFVVHEERGTDAEVERLAELSDEIGVSTEIAVARSEKEGARLAREGAATAVDAVVAVGGDGTINAVVNGLTGTATPLGIIPMGTANDFARQAGIPEDPAQALRLILETEPVLIDTASLNDRHFINVSTGGIGAEATAETSSQLKELLGPVAYAVTGVRKLVGLEPMRLQVSGDDIDVECDALLFAVGNARETGGGRVLTPHASVTDGLLDVCIVEALPVLDLLPLLLKLKDGEHRGERGVHYFQVPSLTIVSDEEMSVNVDGEAVTAARLDYAVHPADLRVFVGRLPCGR